MGLDCPVSDLTLTFIALTTSGMSSPTAVINDAAVPSMASNLTTALQGLIDDEQPQSEIDWLNDLLSNSDDQPDATTTTTPNSLTQLDLKLSKTLGMLDSATHDTSALVDRTIDEISRSVPRLAFDLQLMRENALLLQFTLNAIRKRSTTGQQDSQVSQVMEKLRVLDLVKSRMEAARDVLREAESWSTLESEVTGLVGEQAYGKAAERLEEAARSMVVFQNTVEYEGRRALMVSLQNQLEASLSASLVAAINSHDLKACKSFHAIFCQIQREAEFTAYYFGSRRSNLVDAWTNANIEDCSDSATLASEVAPRPPSVRFTTFLAGFYSELHSLLAEERTYVPAIFPDPLPTLSSFVQSTLEGLTPSLPQRLSAIADRHGPYVLPELIQAYRSTEELAISVDRIMAKVGIPAALAGSPTTPGPPSGTPAKKTRRSSQRLSISRRHGSRSISFGAGSSPGFMNNGEDSVRPWETAIFEPFLDWQVEYPDLERRYLEAETIRQTGGKDIMAELVRSQSEKGARALWDHTVAVFGLMEDAVGRLLALTHGYGAAGLVRVIDVQLVAFTDKRRLELVAASKNKTGPEQSSRRPMDDDEAAFEGLEYSTEDWGAFQFGLRLLDTCRSMVDKLSTFEGKLRGRLTTLAHTVAEAREDPFNYVVPGTTPGAITLLRQSTLNSAELATLLDALEKSSTQDSNGLNTAPSPPSPLLPKARHSIAEFTRATQVFLHDIILAPLLLHLSEYATLSCWTMSNDQRPGAKGLNELAIPTFSLSPTDTISRVGEGLFNLPRLFEVYANDDALAFSLETLPFVNAESLRVIQELQQEAVAPGTTGAIASSGHRVSDSMSAASPGLDSSSSPSHSRRPTLTSIASSQLPPPSRDASVPAQLSPETVIATWLSSLTLGVLAHLSRRVLPRITRLSRTGASQLVADLDYIANVARALDVDVDSSSGSGSGGSGTGPGTGTDQNDVAALEAWRDACAAAIEDQVAGGVKNETGSGTSSTTMSQVQQGVWDRVNKIRGFRAGGGGGAGGATSFAGGAGSGTGASAIASAGGRMGSSEADR